MKEMRGTIAAVVVLLVVAFATPVACGEGDEILLEAGTLAAAPLLGLEVEDGCAGFRGIPYGTAERWRKALPVEELDSRAGPVDGSGQAVFDARAYGFRCFQSGSSMGTYESKPPSEDCLFLNVWVPASAIVDGRAAAGKGMPVMVFIHGGGFTLGSGEDPYIRAKRYSDAGVILVSINYRLGSLGFLAAAMTAGEEDTANFGLLDQRLALEWVQQHIGSFGGDPDNVTIFGESAGAMSVLMHLSVSSTVRTKDGRKLFQRVIAQSSPYLAGLPCEDFYNVAVRMATELGCSVDTPANVLSCLRGKKFEDLYSVSPGFGKVRSVFFHTLDGGFAPCVDKYFPEVPFEVFKAGNFDTSIDIMHGTTKDEGTLFTWLTFPLIDIDEMFFTDMVEQVFQGHAPELPKDVLGRYHRPEAVPTASLGEISNDLYFQCPNAALAEMFSQQRDGGGLFRYVFAQKPATGAQFLEVYHAAELAFVFDMPMGGFIFPSELNDVEKHLSDVMIDYWTSFAKMGVPISESGIDWPQYRENKSTIILEERLHVVSGYKEHECEFWHELYPDSMIQPNPLAQPMKNEPFASWFVNGHLFRTLRTLGAWCIAIPIVLVPMLIFLWLSIKKKTPTTLEEQEKKFDLGKKLQ